MRYTLTMIAAIGLLSQLAIQLSPPSQGGARGGVEGHGTAQPANSRPAVRFTAIDIFIDSADQPLAAYQFELLAGTSAQPPDHQTTAPSVSEPPTSPERKRGVEGDDATPEPDASDVKIVGVEGGEHAAFREPPYYDPAALANNRIIIAAFNTGRDLPTGKTRVARLHLQVTGPEPQYKLKLDVAASAEGKDIPATVTVEPGVTR